MTFSCEVDFFTFLAVLGRQNSDLGSEYCRDGVYISLVRGAHLNRAGTGRRSS